MPFRRWHGAQGLLKTYSYTFCAIATAFHPFCQFRVWVVVHMRYVMSSEPLNQTNGKWGRSTYLRLANLHTQWNIGLRLAETEEAKDNFDVYSLDHLLMTALLRTTQISKSLDMNERREDVTEEPLCLTALETSGQSVSGPKLDNVIIPGSSQHAAFTATAGTGFR
jgi:hypothetical protein